MMDLSLNKIVLNTFQKPSLHSKTAISFFKEKWEQWTYLDLINSSNIVSLGIKKCIKNDVGQFVVLYLNVTQSLVPLVLGVLSASCPFVSLENKSGAPAELIKKLNVQYLITNVDIDTDSLGLEEGASVSETFKIFGEKITIWRTGINTVSEIDNQEKNVFAYAIKTSGTTGKPKIIKVTQRSIVSNIICLSKIFNIGENDVIYLSSPITFDPSIVEIFLSVSNGATLSIIDNRLKRIPSSLLKLLNSKHGPTFIQTTPSLFRSWKINNLRTKLFSCQSNLRTLVLGGECFPTIKELLSWNVPNFISVYNIYGLTEVSCWASINKVWPSKDVPDISIGEPLSETIIKYEKMEDSNAFQLFIGSSTRICLVNDEQFPTVDKLPFFRATGDLFEEVDNKYYYLGRIDDKIKRWGISTHLSVIENVAKNLGFENCLCLSDKPNNDEEIILALFIFCKDPTNENISKFHINLKAGLKLQFWPDEIIFLKDIPLNVHGKIDRQHLITILREKTEGSYQNPEDYFKKLWKHFTRTELESNKSFIASGGDSFSALQLNGLLKQYSTSGNVLGLLLSGASFNDCWMEFQKTLNNSENKRNISDTSTSIKKKLKITPDRTQSIIEKQHNLESTNIIYSCLKGKTFSSLECSVPNKPDISERSFKIVWKYQLGKCVDASPLIVTFRSGESCAIIGSHSGIVVVLDINNGNLISQCILKDRIESSACISQCGKYYYIGCYDGCVYKVLIECGDIAWSFPTGDIVKSTCVLFGESIVFGSYDKNVYKINKECNLEWKCYVDGAVLADVVIKSGKVYVVTLSSKLYILDVYTGQELHRISLSAPVFASPRIFDNYIIIATVDGFVYWNSLENGHQENLFKSEGKIFTSVTSFKNKDLQYFFFGSDNNLISLKQNRPNWSIKLDSNVVATPVVITFFSNIYVIAASSKGTVYLVDLQLGHICKQLSLSNDVFSSPAILNDRIVIGCRDNNVYCLSL